MWDTQIRLKLRDSKYIINAVESSLCPSGLLGGVMRCLASSMTTCALNMGISLRFGTSIELTAAAEGFQKRRAVARLIREGSRGGKSKTAAQPQV